MTSLAKDNRLESLGAIVSTPTKIAIENLMPKTKKSAADYSFPEVSALTKKTDILRKLTAAAPVRDFFATQAVFEGVSLTLVSLPLSNRSSGRDLDFEDVVIQKINLSKHPTTPYSPTSTELIQFEVPDDDVITYQKFNGWRNVQLPLVCLEIPKPR